VDQQLRQLKRATQVNPDDVSVLNRYIAALERVVGVVDPKLPKRRGWKCPDPETGIWTGVRDDESNTGVPRGEGSPDGVCIYFSELRQDGRRTVPLIIDGEPVDWLLPYRSNDEECPVCDDPGCDCGNPGWACTCSEEDDDDRT